MNTSQAAVVLGMTPWWVRRQCAAGELRASYYGGKWSIAPEDISAYRDAHSNAPRTVAARRRPRRA